MKGKGGGGTAKGGGKNKSKGGKNVAKNEKAMATKEIDSNIALLRKALRNDNGTDKDVTAELAPAFMKYDRNGLKLKIRFKTGKDLSKQPDVTDWMFGMIKESMKDRYNASGHGWDDDDKILELSAPEGRFLIVSEENNVDVAFCHFRFTVTGEVIDKMEGDACIQIFDIHIEESIRNKALGKHLLTMLELIGRREKIPLLTIPIQIGDVGTEKWLAKAGRNLFTPDVMAGLEFEAEAEGFNLYSKPLVPAPKNYTPSTPVATPSVQLVDSSVPETKATSIVDKDFDVFTKALETASTHLSHVPIEKDQESDLIAELSSMYLVKHGKEPTEVEIGKWKIDLQSINLKEIDINTTEKEEEKKNTIPKHSLEFTDDDGWTLIDT
jgi:hypothetical protein